MYIYNSCFWELLSFMVGENTLSQPLVDIHDKHCFLHSLSKIIIIQVWMKGFKLLSLCYFVFIICVDFSHYHEEKSLQLKMHNDIVSVQRLSFFVSLWKELSQSLSTTCKTYPENNIRDTLLLLLLLLLFPSKANPTIRGRNEQKFLLKCHPDDWPLIQPIRINKHPSPLTCKREWASCNILKTTIVFTTLITLSPYSQWLYS